MQFCDALIYDGASQVLRVGDGDMKMRRLDGIIDSMDMR